MRHHYIPVFYTKRWAGVDGRLCQYSRPFGTKVRPLRVAPAGTGFLDGLYELRGYEPALAHQIEEKFFKRVDGDAALALEAMETEGNGLVWTDRLRSAWTRFLLSLLLRCPEDLEIFADAYFRGLDSDDDEWEARYQAVRGPDDAPTFAEHMASQTEAWKSQALFEALLGLIDHARIGTFINHMHWHVIEFPVRMAPALMTSDRPVLQTNGLDTPQGHLALAVGPARMFVAMRDRAMMNQICRQEPRQIVENYNRQVVEGARRFVYSKDDQQLRFVQNRMGKAPQPRLMQGLARRILNGIAGPGGDGADG